METQIEKVLELLKLYAENVSANHWVIAIHEDKFENLAVEIVKLFTIQDLAGRSEQLVAFLKWVGHDFEYSAERIVKEYTDAGY